MVDDEGLVYSRVGSEVAIPVLDWDNMKPENRYSTHYNLERFHVFDLCGVSVLRTKKIPKSIKNKHRKFWGFSKI